METLKPQDRNGMVGKWALASRGGESFLVHRRTRKKRQRGMHKVDLLYLGCGAAWGGHLSGRQDSRWVRIPYGPPLTSRRSEARVGLTTNDFQVAAN